MRIASLQNEQKAAKHTGTVNSYYVSPSPLPLSSNFFVLRARTLQVIPNGKLLLELFLQNFF
jgi:hypothetical protein